MEQTLIAFIAIVAALAVPRVMPDALVGWRRAAAIGALRLAFALVALYEILVHQHHLDTGQRGRDRTENLRFRQHRAGSHHRHPWRNRLSSRNHPSRHVSNFDLVQCAQQSRSAARGVGAQRLLWTDRRQRRRAFVGRPDHGRRVARRGPAEVSRRRVFHDAWRPEGPAAQRPEARRLSAESGALPGQDRLYKERPRHNCRHRRRLRSARQDERTDPARHFDHARSGRFGRRRAIIRPDRGRRLQAAHRQNRQRRPHRGVGDAILQGRVG